MSRKERKPSEIIFPAIVVCFIIFVALKIAYEAYLDGVYAGLIPVGILAVMAAIFARLKLRERRQSKVDEPSRDSVAPTARDTVAPSLSERISQTSSDATKSQKTITTTCPNCAHMIDSTTRTCPNCGADIPAPTKAFAIAAALILLTLLALIAARLLGVI
jgi:hypothetical protein